MKSSQKIINLYNHTIFWRNFKKGEEKFNLSDIPNIVYKNGFTILSTDGFNIRALFV
ncbi:hypothetical protein HMPREF0538_21593 [Limosilactobacillus reuteri SD2112]|uniref:Uncharacterized protein n=1 Tax=Limosilactobacillus reuteri (strain ATCC 55730 / SD2112) TaxID=491077 RepID=F8DLX3_LIMRS|nr:hypothetical protein HMPREF0538_21593 [Limosilactobacillus reuteri SD2112]